MGCYVNVPGEKKEVWLEREGKTITLEEAQAHKDFEDVLLIVLVDNGPFNAAAVAHCPSEQKVFLDPGDYRLKDYFLVETRKLLKVSDLAYYRKDLAEKYKEAT